MCIISNVPVESSHAEIIPVVMWSISLLASVRRLLNGDLKGKIEQGYYRFTRRTFS